MPKLKNVKEVAHKIHSTFVSAYAIDSNVNHEWLKNVLKNDRQAIREALREGLEELPIYMYGTPKQNGVIDMQQTIEKNKALALVDELLGGEVTE